METRKDKQEYITINNCYEGGRCAIHGGTCSYRVQGNPLPVNIEQCKVVGIYRNLLNKNKK